jgi:predicted dehydrogenase
MKVAIVGCGYVADQYMSTLVHYKELELIGAYDVVTERTDAFCSYFRVNQYRSFDELLGNQDLELVINLTNPRSHQEVNERCIAAGKHVYSEKPLSLDVESARRLLELARSKRVYIGTAPCNVLGRTAQTLWKAVKEEVVGAVHLVYAAYDDGMIAPNLAPWNWTSRTGAHWPAKDEFEVGCTFEHAGYVLTCLAALFGPAKSVTSFSSCQIPDKGIPVDSMAPDFSVGCIEFENSAIVARVTCGLVAPRDKSLVVVGDKGILVVDNLRDDTAPVYMRTIRPGGLASMAESLLNDVRLFLERVIPWMPWGWKEWHLRRRCPFAVKASSRMVSRDKRVDFCLGPLELAAAIREGRPCRLSGELGLHIVELICALQYPDVERGKQLIKSRFEPIQPLPWT